MLFKRSAVFFTVVLIIAATTKFASAQSGSRPTVSGIVQPVVEGIQGVQATPGFDQAGAIQSSPLVQTPQFVDSGFSTIGANQFGTMSSVAANSYGVYSSNLSSGPCGGCNNPSLPIVSPQQSYFNCTPSAFTHPRYLSLIHISEPTRPY